ncbi:efflux transporter, outer membrane factor (OMF) lipoprotein, NodT family [Oceanospirillum multiglobuliferum]|uniref:RND transporter n=1 Tax=Oceanospirillum multiglobuliferum TaxID=64969 RepID=A0A1T4QWL1_9GAMM|nr:efflux transporter outer membrane subunit [Oceanospirillum multiglobuliferum]OPX57087.1 hypothetical protein BTE48_01265 [Oceanospirillum multiglobuliferum]SKA08104.1 efflux transporter, outer membrane factor (OMF) lipoprotein, NodT family [Oceanospirillum multiglobuliferum]
MFIVESSKIEKFSLKKYGLQILKTASILLLLSACSVSDGKNSDDIVTLPEIGDQVDSINAVSANDEKKVGYSRGVMPSDIGFDLWWRFVGSDELEMLIDRAVVNSQTLQISAQRVVQAKALSIQADASSLPDVNAKAGYSINAPKSGVDSTAKGGSPKANSGTYNIGLDATYTVDLWGQRENLSRSSDLKLKQAIYQYDAELLNLVTELSKRYLEYLSLNDRIANAKESEQALASMLTSMEALYEQGDATAVEMQMQRSSVYNSKILLPSLLLQQKKLEHQIARLVGVAPGELALSNNGLSSVRLPADVRSISSSYILRRPDVRAIEAAMLAADADLHVARAALLPSLTLSSGVGFGSSNFDELFQPHTLMWNFISSLTATIFDGGKKEQQVKYSQAVRAELVESYVFTLYAGLQSAKDALASLEYSEDRLEIQRVSTEASKIAYEFGFESYQVGGIDFLTFLDSAHSYQKRKDELFVFDLEYYQSFVDFYSALGGGILYRGSDKPRYNQKTILSSQVIKRRSYTEGGWLDKAVRVERDDWLVRLSGVYDQFSVEAVLRDLPRRYSNLKPVKEILAEKIGFNKEDRNNGVSWYALSAIGFASKEEAVSWCDMLRKTQQRCIVYKMKDSFEVEGKFTLKAADGIHSLEHMYAINEEKKRSQEVGFEADNKKFNNKYGRVYSLLSINDNEAWLIGNSSYRVWKFSAGDQLHYSGNVRSVDKESVIVSFDGSDYLLKPIYYLEKVESNSAGSLVAKVRWGGRSGKVFFYRVGDKVYGNGTVEEINSNAVVINWKGYRISLALNQ